MNSIKKSHWDECRHLIKKANKAFYDLLSEMKPSNKMPIYIATYTYGETIGSKTKFFIPDNTGGTFQLGSKDTPSEIMKDLGYGMHSCPLGMIINNYCEWFSSDKEEKDTNATMPFAIQGVGTIFNKEVVFKEEEGVENSTLSVCSGSRSAFMLSNIGSRLNHEKLREHFDIQETPPKNHYEHFDIFKTITKNDGWHTTLIFFSKKWIDEIKKNRQWSHVRLFLSEQMRKKAGNDLFSFSYNDLFMSAQKVNKFRPTPFLVDTAKLIFNIAANQGCAHAPATDESKLPLKSIQKIFKELYELKYNPTVMVPSTLSQSNKTVYYSLQIPSTKVTTFKIKLNNSTIKELDALKDILMAYTKEFTHEESPCYGSLLYKTSKNLSLDFYHNAPTIKGIDTSDSIQEDERFLFSYDTPGEFARDAKFFRGCIKISTAA